jgi:hypothetical protein
MLPVFRSNSSVLSFCGLLIGLLCLPVVTSWIGHPSREQAYVGMSGEVGPIGMHMREIYGERGNADVIFLGSSLVRAAIDEPTVESALAEHLGRPARVEMLALNWQGLDLQYFLLRDYLKTHRAKLIVWNLPVPGSRNLVPHVEAFRWLRFGEYSEALDGLPLRYRLAIYGDMVLGAPRELLSHLRRNRLSKDEMAFQLHSEKTGYYGAPFVPDSAEGSREPGLEQSYEAPPYGLVHATGKPLNEYEDHFAKKIVELAAQNGTRIALIHIPIDTERGLNYMPERSSWPDVLHTNSVMIGESSSVLFDGVNDAKLEDFYRDQHFNLNGSLLFTRSVLPALLKAYEAGETH